MDTLQDIENMVDALECHFPVTVVLKKTWRNHRNWRYPHWVVSGVLPEEEVHQNNHGSNIGAQDKTTQTAIQKFTSDSGDEIYIWPGLQFSLYRDGLTSYFQNLSSVQPVLFILCRDDEEQATIEPILVSADFADAEAHMETEGTVLTVPLNSPFDKWIAEYVLNNKVYLEKQAHEGKKHKRKKATTRE